MCCIDQRQTPPALTPAAEAARAQWFRDITARQHVTAQLARLHPYHTASLVRHLVETENRGAAAAIARQLGEHANRTESAERFHVALSPEELAIVLAALDGLSLFVPHPAALDLAADLRFVALAEGVTNPAHGL